MRLVTRVGGRPKSWSTSRKKVQAAPARFPSRKIITTMRRKTVWARAQSPGTSRSWLKTGMRESICSTRKFLIGSRMHSGMSRKGPSTKSPMRPMRSPRVATRRESALSTGSIQVLSVSSASWARSKTPTTFSVAHWPRAAASSESHWSWPESGLSRVFSPRAVKKPVTSPTSSPTRPVTQVEAEVRLSCTPAMARRMPGRTMSRRRSWFSATSPSSSMLSAICMALSIQVVTVSRRLRMASSGRKAVIFSTTALIGVMTGSRTVLTSSHTSPALRVIQPTRPSLPSSSVPSPKPRRFLTSVQTEEA